MQSSMRSRSLPALIVFVALCCSMMFAQTTTGDMRGTVTDPAGAVVPGAAPDLSDMRSIRPSGKYDPAGCVELGRLRRQVGMRDEVGIDDCT